MDETYCFELTVGTHLVGRSPEADIHLPDASVSSQHAEILCAPGGNFAVKDLGSTNGTFLGSERIHSLALSVGQIVTFGNVRLQIDTEAASISVPRPTVAAQPEPSWMPNGDPACLLHPGVPATFRCTKCEQCLCSDCIREVGLQGRKPTYFCLKCSGRALKLRTSAAKGPKRSHYRKFVDVVNKVDNFFKR